MIMILIAHEALCYELDIEKDEKGFHICRQIGAWDKKQGKISGYRVVTRRTNNVDSLSNVEDLPCHLRESTARPRRTKCSREQEGGVP